MIPGSPSTVPPGDNAGMIAYLTTASIPGGVNVLIQAREGYGQFFVVVFDGNIIGAFNVSDSAVAAIPVFSPDDDGETSIHSIIVIPNGEWPYALKEYCETAIQYYGIDTARTILFSIVPTLQYLPSDPSFDVTATDGAKRGANINNDTEGRANWASFDYEIADIGGGNFSVTITARSMTVAYGEGPAGSVTADPVNNSGLSVTGDVTGVGSGTCYIRWPESYILHWDDESHTIPDDGASNLFAYTTPLLDGGTYTCYVEQVDDNDNVSSSTTPIDLDVFVYPNPPENLAYDSGDNAATVIAWDAPSTGPAPDSYDVFDSGANAENFLDTFTPAQSTASTSDTLTAGLPALPYTRKIIVRSSLGGNAEQNLTTLEIEYDAAGDVVPARPNTPTLFGSPNATGRKFECVASYDPAGQAATPERIRLYAWPQVDIGVWFPWNNVVADYIIASHPQTESDINSGQVVFVTLDMPSDFPSMPFFPDSTLVYFGLRAQAADGTDDGNLTVLGPVEITATPTAPPTATIGLGA